VTLLLDTHALLWWMDPPGRLSTEQQRVISDAQTDGEILAIAAVTLWEIAKLVASRRLSFAESIETLVLRFEHHPELRILPLDGRVAIESTQLGDAFPKDPADQLIAATARVHGLRLVTADEHIRRSGVVPVV
jgi:PIN domain nuclease of toxin-antitoxin system